MTPQRTNIHRLGLDLDNTLIDYTASFGHLAPAFGIKKADSSRERVRKQLRRPADDEEWQRFQSLLYTEGLTFAMPAPGALEFIRECGLSGIEVFVVSHKTESGPERFGGRQLRTPARQWLARHRLVPDLIPDNHVFFTNSVDEKVDSIADLKLDAFVDDLPEILSHPGWPLSTMRIEYSRVNSGQHSPYWCLDFNALRSWLFQ